MDGNGSPSARSGEADPFREENGGPVRKLFSLFFAALALSGCGSDSNEAGQFNPPPNQVVKIGVIAPLNAGLTDFGRGIRDSVQLAVSQANASGRFPGITFVMDARDDSSNPAVGVQAAQALAADPAVLGVVGTYNSGVAAQVLPVLAPTNLTMISPGNTDPSLTAGHPFANYFRLVVPDSIQGPVLANHTFNTLGLRNVAIVSENKSVSTGLVDAYAQQFTQLGGTITTRQIFPVGTTDFSQIIPVVNATNPQLVLFGGEFNTATPFRVQSFNAGLRVPLMGSDGIKDDAYTAGAGAASNGDFASSVGAPITQQPGATAFLRDYQAANFPEPPSDFGPYAYDAANLLINAIGSGASTRSAVLQRVAGANTTGVTGPISFDANGDTRNKVVTIYQVVNSTFVPRTTVTVP